MYLSKTRLINYKNIGDATLCLSPKINCLIGSNGEGKTNILDAVHYLSFCRSASTPLDAHVIRHNHTICTMEGTYIADDGTEEQIFCGLRVGLKKRVRRNKKEYKRLSEHIGLVPLILVSPADTVLIDGNSEVRRRLLDMVIAQYDRHYIDALNHYNKALAQRNQLLRQDTAPDASLLDIIEVQMGIYGEQVSLQREALVEQIEPLFQHYYSEISGEREKVSLRYVSPCQRGNLRELIASYRPKDLALGYSICGIHRDDLEMLVNGHPMKQDGSQGQRKTFVIALKLAQYTFLMQRRGSETPLLLLDDVFDKLDAQRVEQIVRIVAGEGFGQIFLTDTNRDHLDKILRSTPYDYKIFYVKGGEVTEQEQKDGKEDGDVQA